MNEDLSDTINQIHVRLAAREVYKDGVLLDKATFWRCIARSLHVTGHRDEIEKMGLRLKRVKDSKKLYYALQWLPDDALKNMAEELLR